MAGYLIDTNIWSFLLKRSYSKLNARFAKLQPDQMFLSPVVLGELETGYLKGDKMPQHRQALDLIIATTQHLSITQETAVRYSYLRTQLELSGTPIGRNDTWIAAEALHHKLILVTDNVGEFERVKGLKVENWI
jgi:tRNA(fMet)-specific endonuclease VapC